MNTLEMDSIFSAALREVLVATVEDTPRVGRRWRWRLGAGMFAGGSLIAGGVALAAGLLTSPGAPIDTPLGIGVTVTRTGSATIYLGHPPAKATDISLTLTCLTVGTFDFPNGSSFTCDASDLSPPASDTPQTNEVVPLSPGKYTVTIETSGNASWRLQAMYVNRVTTSWGTNASGETYGVVNQKGTPDLIAVAQGKTQGYVEASELNCAAGGDVHSPTQALAWDKGSANRNISIPVYESNGTTVVGSFVVGGASGPNARTVPLSSLSLDCSTTGNGPAINSP